MATPQVYKTTGIILKRNNSGEGDKILSVFCEHIGKKRFIAKGIRKITSRRSSHLELFSKTNFLIYRGKTGEYITEAKVVHLYGRQFTHLSQIAASYCACEIIDRLTLDGQEQEYGYSLLDQFLLSIENVEGVDVAIQLQQYIDRVLFHFGYTSLDGKSGTLGNAIAVVERIAERKIRSVNVLTKSGIELYRHYDREE
jgi:DNA repair protein RecO (recombination protein O)